MWEKGLRKGCCSSRAVEGCAGGGVLGQAVEKQSHGGL